MEIQESFIETKCIVWGFGGLNLKQAAWSTAASRSLSFRGVEDKLEQNKTAEMLISLPPDMWPGVHISVKHHWNSRTVQERLMLSIG